MVKTHDESKFFEKKNGKVYLTHFYVFELIGKFVEYHGLASYTDFEDFVKGKTGFRTNLSIRELFNDYARRNEGIRSVIGNSITKQMFRDFFDGKMTGNYESDLRGERRVAMFDVNGKKLAPTTFKRALTYKLKEKGDWIEEGISFRFNHAILDEVNPLDTVFNRIYKKQGGRCASTGKPLGYEEASFHHKYIPQCVFRCNADWNIEILSQTEHERKHSDPLALVNILISIMRFKKNLKKSFQKKVNRRLHKFRFKHLPKIKKWLNTVLD